MLYEVITGDRKSNEEKLNAIRQKYIDLLSGYSGIHLTYLCVVNKDNIKEIETIVNWSVKHANSLDFLTFIPMRQIQFDDDEKADTSKNIEIEDLCEEIARIVPDIQYASYLGGTVSNTSIKWLQAPWIVLNGKIIGFAGSKFVEFVITSYSIHYTKLYDGH